jgi:hypothetical protein
MKKTLDREQKICYNKDVPRGTKEIFAEWHCDSHCHDERSSYDSE